MGEAPIRDLILKIIVLFLTVIKMIRSQKKFKLWWDSECQDAINLRKKYYKELLKNPNKV